MTRLTVVQGSGGGAEPDELQQRFDRMQRGEPAQPPTREALHERLELAVRFAGNQLAWMGTNGVTCAGVAQAYRDVADTLELLQAFDAGPERAA